MTVGLAVCEKCGRVAEPKEGVTYCASCDWWTNWPLTGNHAVVWAKFEACGFIDEEKDLLCTALGRWRDETSTLVAYTNETGEWVDVEPDWNEPKRWLHGDETGG